MVQLRWLCFQHGLFISFVYDPTWGCKTHKVWLAYGVRVSSRLHVLETQSCVWQQKEMVESLSGRWSQDSTIINGLSPRNGPSLTGVAPSRSVWLGSSSNLCLLTHAALLNTETSHFASSDHVKVQVRECSPDVWVMLFAICSHENCEQSKILSCTHHLHQAFCVGNRKQSVTPCQIHLSNKSTGQ